MKDIENSMITHGDDWEQYDGWERPADDADELFEQMRAHDAEMIERALEDARERDVLRFRLATVIRHLECYNKYDLREIAQILKDCQSALSPERITGLSALLREQAE